MSKIVLNDVTNLNALSVINDNFDKIKQELQNKVLYRDNPEGEPNSLQDDVDANGNSIYNIQDLTINGAFTVQGQDVGAYIGQAAVSAADALASKTAAATSASNSQASATSSATSAATATAQATIATTKASESSESATVSAGSATTATTKADIATTQAGIATTQAGIATTQASNAAASASTSTTQAGIATTQASNASASATSATASATDAAASAAAAATALDNFDDRYLGSKATAPTLDNDGNALLTGALYYNNGTVNVLDKGMWVYDGGNWIKTSAASQAILTSYTYVATAGQTSFSGADVNSLVLSYTAGSIFPTLNGQRLRNGVDYTATTGSTFVLAVAAAAGDELIIDAFSTFNVANVYTKAEEDVKFAAKLDTTAGAVGNTNLAAGAVDATKLATAAVTTTKIADANVTLAKLSATGAPSSSTYLRGDNTWSTISGYTGPNFALFTGSGTFTVPAGITSVKVTLSAGGGGSSSTYNTTGGRGGRAIGVYSVTPGAGIAVTVGAGGSGGTTGSAGGTSSFGSSISATGGGGAGAGATGVFGTGSGGNIHNSVNSDDQGIWYGILGSIGRGGQSSFGPWTGNSFRVNSATHRAAGLAFSISNTNLPGAGGQCGTDGCNFFYTGGVGGVVLVEW